MKQMPRIDKFMTTLPHTIGSDIPLDTAVKMMKEQGIRHLPVQTAGKLVGVLTDRDVKLALSFAGASSLTVQDVMSADPFTAVPDAPLDQVVFAMAEHRYGCAVIEQSNGKTVGIFTATDGLRVLGDMLNEHYRKASI